MWNNSTPKMPAPHRELIALRATASACSQLEV